MKQHYLIGIFMAATILTACTDEDQSISTPQDGVLKATVEGNKISSRAGFVPKDQTNPGAFYWSKDDKIGVTTDQASAQFSQMTLTEGIGQSSGSFEGTISGNIQGYAVYPYNEKHSINGSTLTYYFKPEYTYDTVDADFATPQQGYGNSFNPAMFGQISNGNVTFKHLGGVCCIKIPTLPTGSDYKLKLISDKKISGSYTTTDLSAEPVITATTATTGDEKTVTITFSNNNQNTSGVFYVPVPVGEHTLRLKVTNSSQEEVINTALGTFNFTRRFLKELALNNGTINGGEAREVASASSVKDELAKSDIVAVTGNISGNATVEIPASTSTGSNESKNVIFEKVAEKTALTVVDKAAGGATPVKGLTLSFAANETTEIDKAPSVTITTPQTTTTLAAVSGSLKLKEVTASTAENTLIVGTGVTINTLKIVKGNVRVNNGAVVNAITNEIPGGNTKVTIIKETGAQLLGKLDNAKFNVIDAAIADLEETAKNGGSYTLTQDLVLSRALNVQGSTMTLNLNGHSIKPKAGGLDAIEGLNTVDGLILVRRGAHLTINDSSNGKGSIDYNEESTIYTAVKLTDSNDGSTGPEAVLTVNGGTLKGYSAGICGNGTRHGTQITINGGTITAANTDATNDVAGIYHPQDGTLTVNEGNISGLTGIEIRAGKLIVNGGTIESTATEFNNKSNGSGTTIIGAAVAVSQHTTNKALKATIKGTSVLNAPYALYEEDLQDEKATDQISLEVSGGTLNGKMHSENCKSFITGGTFSDLSTALEYFGTTANVAINKDCSISNLTIQAEMTVSIDLNKKAITITDKYTNCVYGNLTLSNGTFNDNKGGLGLEADNAKLELNGIHYNSSEGSGGIFNDKNIQNTTLTIKNSDINGGFYGVSTNASTDPVGSTTFNFEDSHFKAAETPFIINIPATVLIKGCTFSGGNHQAAFIRGGNCTIEDSDFTLNATLSTNHSENNRLKTWEDGNRATFAGITIGNYLNTAYQYPTIVNMKNVKVTTSGTNASLFPAMHVCANSDTDKAVTITYDDQCSFTSAGYSTPIEYGTVNITVNNEAKTANIANN